MVRINVSKKYIVVAENRRVRVVDRENGAVVVDFIAPLDAPKGLGDAMKQVFDALAPQTKSAATVKKKATKRAKKDDDKADDDGNDVATDNDNPSGGND